MNILVCISRVPDTATKVTIGQDGKSIEKQGVKFVVNPYDEYAVEEALQIREKSGANVTAITVGTEEAKDVLRTSFAMGVDKAVLVKAADADSYVVAKNLADYAKNNEPNLILVGRQSIDFDSFQMASMLSEMLNMPSVSVVAGLEIADGKVIAQRDIEGGKEVVTAKMPCVISCQKGLNEPRYPKLPDIMKAKSKPIEEIDGASVENKVEVLSMELPAKQRKGVILGDTDGDVDELVRLLHEEAKVI